MRKLLLTFLLFAATLNAQEAIINRADNFYKELSWFLGDGYHWFIAPVRFTTNDWLITGGVIGGTFLTFSADEEIQKRVSRKVNKSFNGDFWDWPARYGMFEYQNIASLSMYGIGLIIDHKDTRDLGRLLFTSITFAEFTVMGIRMLLARERPFSELGAWEFKGFRLDNGVQSFPSGHVTVAFAFSTILAEFYGTTWSRIGFYGAAALVWYARMYNNLHWFSDVTFGAALGIGSGLFVMYRENLRLGKNKELPVSITPTFNGLNIRVALN